MHDLESFSWLLFWICIHFDGPKMDRVISRFDKWNYVDTDERVEAQCCIEGEDVHENDYQLVHAALLDPCAADEQPSEGSRLWGQAVET